PEKVALAYTEDTQWRNRDEFLVGRDQVIEFLTRKWQKELDYKLKKELFTFQSDRIAVHFEYEWHDEAGQWYRSYGNEHWVFEASGLMKTRDASINDKPIHESERLFST
ncbi:MAG: nuclear transport factor 2 family protein, partial [Cyanobacteria bacterium]|nr:nuclear transport factor 2 family protein [Cyanobacteriota bacterium]